LYNSILFDLTNTRNPASYPVFFWIYSSKKVLLLH